MPLLVLKKGETDENGGVIVDGLLIANEPPGKDPPAKETGSIRELGCRVFRPRLDIIEEV